MEKTYNDELIFRILEATYKELELIEPLGGDIFNALDIVMYDFFGDDEPIGLYTYLNNLLKG